MTAVIVDILANIRLVGDDGVVHLVGRSSASWGGMTACSLWWLIPSAVDYDERFMFRGVRTRDPLNCLLCIALEEP